MSTIFRNARVGSSVLDVLVEDGAITEIGSAVDCTAEEVHLDGRWLLPGLWDNHVHFSQLAMVQQRLDVAPAESAAQAADLVAAATLPELVEGQLVEGASSKGWRKGRCPLQPEWRGHPARASFWWKFHNKRRRRALAGDLPDRPAMLCGRKSGHGLSRNLWPVRFGRSRRERCGAGSSVA